MIFSNVSGREVKFVFQAIIEKNNYEAVTDSG